MKILNFITLGFLAAIASVNVRGASLGDPAPPLPIEKWVKGTPVRVGPGGTIYVVEFWATWCPPCKRSIPHLTELQKKYGNKVAIVGVSDEALTDVQPFVAAQGASMDYRVAVDSTQRSYKNWMGAYGETGIPHAFIVGTNGTVLWHDFPAENLERALDQILAGTYDLDRAKNMETGERLMKQYIASMQKTRNATNGAALGDRILTDFSQDWRIPYRLAMAIMMDPKIAARDIPLALRAATKAVELTGRRSSDALTAQGRAMFASGQRTEGIATLKEALALSRDAEDQAELRKLIAMLEKAPAAPVKK